MRVKEQVYLLFCDFANCLSFCKNGFDNGKHDIFTYSSHGIYGAELKSFMYDRSSREILISSEDVRASIPRQEYISVRFRSNLMSMFSDRTVMQTDEFSTFVSTTGDQFLIYSLCYFPYCLILLREALKCVNVSLTNPARLATSDNDNLKKCI